LTATAQKACSVSLCSGQAGFVTFLRETAAHIDGPRVLAPQRGRVKSNGFQPIHGCLYDLSLLVEGEMGLERGIARSGRNNDDIRPGRAQGTLFDASDNGLALLSSEVFLVLGNVLGSSSKYTEGLRRLKGGNQLLSLPKVRTLLNASTSNCGSRVQPICRQSRVFVVGFQRSVSESLSGDVSLTSGPRGAGDANGGRGGLPRILGARTV